jgi:glycosyltransferase involved in cell wall biosynthesis
VRVVEPGQVDPVTAASGGDSVLILDPGNFTPAYDCNLARALKALRWDVEWVTSDYEFESVAAPDGVRVRRAFFRSLPPRGGSRSRIPRLIVKGLSYPIDLVRLDEHLKGRSPGVIHVQWSHLPWLDAVLWERWRKLGWRIVYTAHDVRPLAGTTPRLLAQGYSGLVARADAVVVHDEHARAAVVELGAVPARVHVIPAAPPVSPDVPHPTRAAARAALGLPAASPVVLFFGFVKPYKGLAVLLRSLPTVKRIVGQVELLIAGELTGSASRYDRIALELGVSESVRWRRGFVPGNEVGTFFAAADVVALPYLEASSSGVLLTAYVFGRPVVATAVGGLGELVDVGESGMLVPARDPEALGEALGALLGDPRLAERMGSRGLELTEQRFSWAGMARRLDVIYRELLA